MRRYVRGLAPSPLKVISRHISIFVNMASSEDDWSGGSDVEADIAVEIEHEDLSTISTEALRIGT